MKTEVIIVAAGLGKRFGSTDKVLTLVKGKPLFIWAIQPFENLREIHNISIVTRREVFERVQSYLKKVNIKKVSRIIEGGKERQDSVHNALKALPDDTDIVLIHDAARPLVSEELIKNILKCLTTSIDGVIPSIPLTDTIKWIKKGDLVGGTINRDVLRAIQTPQAFWYKKLISAYENAYKEGFYGTDDASLIERYGGTVIVAKGDTKNIKITTKEDLEKMEFLIDRNSQNFENLRIGFGYDSHRFEKGRKLIIGGVEIPYESGLAGHSDADVLVHAIIDALLGSAGLGDIGRHFPDTDPAYENVSSLILLKKTLEILKSHNVEPLWIDCTIFTEKPKMAPYITKMQKNLQRLGIITNIKAKTNEKMGFIGRQEGIAAQAVCLSKVIKI